jgi:hypothetical protein
MSKTLKYGREHVTIDDEAVEIVTCPSCAMPMTHHADKLVSADTGGVEAVVATAYACAQCGMSTMAAAPELAAQT